MKLIDYYNRFIERLRRHNYNVDTTRFNYYWFLVFRDLTQAQKIWWHLKTFKKVTSADVEQIYFFSHPPSIIRDIRNKLIEQGSDFRIENKEQNGTTIWGKPCKYDEYTLETNK